MNLFNRGKRIIQKYIWENFWRYYQLPEISIESLDPKFRTYIPIYTEDICLPPYKGDTAFIDYSVLISLIKAKKPARILELGTAQGNTVANICAESNSLVFTINALPEQIEGNLISFSINKEEIGKVFRKNGFERRVSQIYENTKKLNVLDYLPSKSIDFAIIDACHDMDFVVNDYTKIFPSISDDCIVLFHDTYPSTEQFYLESYLACMYLRRKGFNVKHIKNSSWGYWSSNDPYPNQSFYIRLKNKYCLIIESIFFGGKENSIKSLRWLASGFLRDKFDSSK